jgi:hypothetical protein
MLSSARDFRSGAESQSTKRVDYVPQRMRGYAQVAENEWQSWDI